MEGVGRGKGTIINHGSNAYVPFLGESKTLQTEAELKEKREEGNRREVFL